MRGDDGLASAIVFGLILGCGFGVYSCYQELDKKEEIQKSEREIKEEECALKCKTHPFKLTRKNKCVCDITKEIR